MLCHKCQNCLQIEDGLGKGQESQLSAHHLTYQDLQQAIDEGCYICNRFWEALSAQERGWLSSTSSERVEPPDANCALIPDKGYLTSTSLADGTKYGHPGCYLLHVAYKRHALDPLFSLYTTYSRGSFLLAPAENANINVVHRSLTQNTGSPETLALAKHWVKECLTHHEGCKKPIDEKPWYPTRLLSFDLNDTSMVRLLDTDQTTLVGQYMTLTHRWGPTEHLMLTKDTYPQLLDGVLLSALPQVFQDAISICRHMGVGYIWIDSLCILQGKDNIRDWQHEASLMRNVYSNSFCNISAADASDSSQSIFGSRDPGTIIPQEVEMTISGGEGGKTTERLILSDYRFWKTEVTDALVNKRAWVLQERFLAPRILHFGKRQLIWECCEKDAAEVYTDGLPPALRTSSESGFKQLDSSEYIGQKYRYKEREAEGVSAPHLLWYRIVDSYSASALTVPTDKLVACSGIAKRMADILQDDYVAGMWRRYLEGELLWMVSFNHQPERWARPREYRAPTWSWASVDGHVTPGEPRIQDSLITVEDYHLDYWTDDKTSAIRGGWLRLRGVLKKTTLGRRPPASGGGYYWDMAIDDEKADSLEEAHVVPGNSEPRAMLDVLQEDFEEENRKGLLFYVCARSKKEEGGGMYLLLLKMVEEKTGTFQRIGLAYAWRNKTKERILRRSSEEAKLPCIEYQDGLHSIYII
ncbi:hypothetical protein G7046_g8839 [Stylonectria norvegica]|nr:hypothetical protein G7046_g8839 [Stylonectria norvegica]